MLLAGAGGTAIALIESHFAGHGSLLGIIGESPSPAGSPQPSDSASSTPTPTQVYLGPVESNAGETVPVPAGWTVNSRDDRTFSLGDPNGYGSVTVESGTSSPPATAQQYRDSVDAYFEGKYPDTAPCPNSALASGTLDGASGIFWVLCFTMTAGGQSFPAAAAMFAGANSSGTVFYTVTVLASPDNLQNLVDESKPVVQGIQWKLN